MKDRQDILNTLNEKQRAAVELEGRPLLIFAGPGSGKTRVITSKIAWLIRTGRCEANKILAVTFTNKAAREMEKRVRNFLGNDESPMVHARDVHQPFISTFHSLGAFLLRTFAEEAGLDAGFAIYDDSEQRRVLKMMYPKMDKRDIEIIRRGINRAKNVGLSSSVSFRKLKYYMSQPAYYIEYEKKKKEMKGLDFGDLLLLPNSLIRERQDVKEQIHDMWEWILVDEYQDTNRVQSYFLRELCAHTQNICVVGDDDQSIYGFRGADVRNILNFERYYKHTEVISLEQNYRSSPEIVQVARSIIGKNEHRYGKNIFSTLQSGSKPVVAISVREDDEFSYVTKIVKKAQQERESCAVFFRTNSQSRGYEMEFQRTGVPYGVMGTVGFFKRKEVQDALAYMKLFYNGFDLISFQRIGNVPVRGIGKRSMDAIVEGVLKKKKEWDEPELWKNLSYRAQEGYRALKNAFDYVKKLSTNECIATVAETLLRESGFLSYYEKTTDLTDGVNSARLNIEEIVRYASGFSNDREGWESFLESVSLAEGAPSEKKIQENAVQLMTLHRAKGLEFDTVVLCGVEEASIPIMSDPTAEEKEEERRLFYVGVTRARKKLFLTYTKRRQVYGRTEWRKMSSFVRDIPKELLSFITVSPSDLGRDSVRRNDARDYARKNFFEREEIRLGSPIPVEWEAGNAVVHRRYGRGIVRAVQQQAGHPIVLVEFEDGKERKILPKFDEELTKARWKK